MALVAACSTGRNESPPVESDAPARPTAQAGYVTLERTAHPLARPENDVGRLDGARVIHNLSLVFKPTAAQRAARDTLLQEIQRPGSPSYHRWLKPEDYAARFGADPKTIAAATAWLAAQGLTVHDPSPLGARATFTGTVAQIEAAFRTEMHAYDVGGKRHYAMARPPSVPSAFADRVLGLINAHDFYPRRDRPQIRVVGPDATCPAGDTECNGNGIAPPDWSVIYDVNTLYDTGINGTKITGAGVTIMVVGVTDIAQKDLTAFRTRYGLATNNITKTVVPNTGAAQADNGAGLEAVLDTEWAGAIAPGATVNYVYTGADDPDVDDAVFYAIEQNYGGVLSESWGGCEEGTAPADGDVSEVYGAAAALQGISYLAASGDSGAADCGGKGGLYVNMPASLPHVTGVGGTGFSTAGGLTFTGGTVSAVGTEAVWNEADNAYTNAGVSAGGGGISAVYSRPLYQSAIATCTPVGTLPTTVNAATQRQVPDVAFTAATGGSQYGIFIECTMANNDCTNTGANPEVVEIGGTSASTPSFAGVVALANQATGGRLGNLNPLLYATSGSVPAAFRDVQTGNNEVVCRTGDPGCPGNNKLYGYAATKGYDCATGLGSVDATKLVSAWATLTPTTTAISASPTATTEGGMVTLTATVDVTGTNAQALAGDVSFVFRSHLTNQVLDLSWALGDVVITNGTTTSGSVTLSTSIPPGMVQPNQAVDVYAMYGGDTHHLPSFSAAQPVTFSSPVTLCIAPATDTLAAGAKVTYTAAGGVPPVRWYLDWDTTCNTQGTGCSDIDVTTGVFTAGTGEAGYVIVVAVDADGAETFSEVTVAGGSGTVPWSSSGPSNYAGIVPSKIALAACPAGDNCGSVPDGCGGTLNCGTCASPLTCGGGGTPNVCGGCTPLTACPAGDNCGTVSDGCGGMLSCGTCTSPQTCGGGGTANVCGCTPLAVCPAGDDCGTLSNGCGGMLFCGNCGAGQTCTGNTCVASSSSSSTSSSSTSTSSSSSSSTSSSSSSSTSSSSSSSTSSSSSSSGSTSSSSGSSGDAGTGGSGGSGGSGTTSSSSSGATGGAGGSGTSSSSSSSTGTLSLGGSGTGGSGAGGSAIGSGGSGTTGTPTQSGGCNCEVAGEPQPTMPRGLAAFGVLALAGAFRSRRRRA
jgi:MYXO-CTERM domain-containing protein